MGWIDRWIYLSILSIHPSLQFPSGVIKAIYSSIHPSITAISLWGLVKSPVRLRRAIYTYNSIMILHGKLFDNDINGDMKIVSDRSRLTCQVRRPHWDPQYRWITKLFSHDGGILRVLLHWQCDTGQASPSSFPFSTLSCLSINLILAYFIQVQAK